MIFDRDTLDRLFCYCLTLACDLLHTALESYLRHMALEPVMVSRA